MRSEKVNFNPVDVWDLLFEDDEIKGKRESQEHLDKKKSVAREFIDDGYDVSLETHTSYGYIVDIVARKNNTMVAVEVGRTDQSKLEDLRDHFDAVKHIGYTDGCGNEVKEVQKRGRQRKIKCYVIPRLGGEPAYDVNIQTDPEYRDIIDGKTVVVTRETVAEFHRSCINVGVLEWESNTSIEYIKSEINE